MLSIFVVVVVLCLSDVLRSRFSFRCETSHLHGRMFFLCLDFGYSGVSSHRSKLPGRVQDPEEHLALAGGRRRRVLSRSKVGPNWDTMRFR